MMKINLVVNPITRIDKLMRKTVFLIFLCIGCCLQAQNLVFHAGGGLTSHYGSSSRNIGAFKIGASVEFELSQKLTVEPGLLYFAKGWKDKDVTVFAYDLEGNQLFDQNNDPITGVMNTTSKTDYLVLPIIFNYYIPLSLPHYIYLSAGSYVAYGIGGKTRTSGDTSQKTEAARHYYDYSTFGRKGMHRFDAGLSVGVGYEFSRMINAGIEANFGLVNINTTGRKNLSLMLTLGYRIPMD